MSYWPFSRSGTVKPTVTPSMRKQVGTLADIITNTKAKEAEPMNIFKDLSNVGSKAVAFLLTVFTKTQKVAAAISKLTPGVLAAMMAVFYDVVKAAQAADAAVNAAASGSLPTAFTLSENTIALVKTVVADAKAGEQTVVDDLKTLGIVSE